MATDSIMAKTLGVAIKLLFIAFAVSLLSCEALDPLSRDFFLVNTCGCTLNLYWINHENNDERILRKEGISDGTNVNSTGIVGNEFEAVQVANSTGNCTVSASTFKINDNYAQGMPEVNS